MNENNVSDRTPQATGALAFLKQAIQKLLDLLHRIFGRTFGLGREPAKDPAQRDRTIDNQRGGVVVPDRDIQQPGQEQEHGVRNRSEPNHNVAGNLVRAASVGAVAAINTKRVIDMGKAHVVNRSSSRSQTPNAPEPESLWGRLRAILSVAVNRVRDFFRFNPNSGQAQARSGPHSYWSSGRDAQDAEFRTITVPRFTMFAPAAQLSGPEPDNNGGFQPEGPSAPVPGGNRPGPRHGGPSSPQFA